LVPIFVKFFQISPNFCFVFKYIPIFFNFVQLGHFLLTSFKSLTAMNSDCHVLFCSFFEFEFEFIWIYLNIFIFFKCICVNPIVCHVSLCGFFEFFYYFFDFFDFFWFFLKFLKCPRVNLVACHVSKSMLYIQFGPYICYFCSIESQFLLKLTNLVFLQIVTKFNFYIKIHIFY